MAKVPIAEIPFNDAAERMTDLNDAEGGELFRAIEEARSTEGAVVILSRTMPADKAGFCDKIPVAEFDLTMIKQKYGPGTYRVRFNGPTGFLPGGSTIKISPMPEKIVSENSSSDFQTFLEAQSRRDAERSSKIWELAMISVPALLTGLFNRQTPQSDMPAILAALKPAPGPTLSDLSTVMVNMQQLNAPKNDSTVDTVLKVFEAAQGLIGGKDSEGKTAEGSNWVDVIRDIIKVAPEAIKPMLEARMNAAMQTQLHSVQPVPKVSIAPVVAQTSGTVPLAENISVGNAGSGDNMRALWEPIAKQHLAKVFGWAEKQRDPEIYAEVFVDELPDLSAYLSVDQVLEHLSNPIWFEKVCELEPRLKSHKDYCTEMRDSVIDIVKDIKADMTEETPKEETTKGNDAPSAES